MNADIVVPALTLRTPSGHVDETATAKYAQRAATTWVDRFILSGTTTKGQRQSEAERTAVLDLWLGLASSTRLLACCWSMGDVENARRRAVTPIVVMRDLPDRAAAYKFLRSLPAGAYVYSHPTHSPVVLDAQLCADTRAAGFLPVGAKVAKVTRGDIQAMRAQTSPEFALWDASSRDVRASVAAGASGVVATPLSPIARPFPARDLDRMDQEARHAHLAGLAAAAT